MALALNPKYTIMLELNHKDPVVVIVFDEQAICPECNESYWLQQQDAEDQCVNCCLLESESDFIILFGWKIMRSARQMVVSRI